MSKRRKPLLGMFNIECPMPNVEVGKARRCEGKTVQVADLRSRQARF
jgi:hypothetical protein